MTLPRIMVAPNGARLQKADHPAIPVTLEEILDCAALCQAEGAEGLHLHLRDRNGGHLLDAGAYREALRALATRCPGLMVQITTEAVGKYAPEAQRDVALTSGAAHVSVAVRELCRDSGATAFYRHCAEAGLAVQHILFDVQDARLLKSVLSAEAFAAPHMQLLFVLGRYTVNQDSQPADLDPFLNWMAEEKIHPDWAVCAFGRNETRCLLHAHRHGGKCRVGFENSTWSRDGTQAQDNPQRVRELVQALGAEEPGLPVSRD